MESKTGRTSTATPGAPTSRPVAAPAGPVASERATKLVDEGNEVATGSGGAELNHLTGELGSAVADIDRKFAELKARFDLLGRLAARKLAGMFGGAGAAADGAGPSETWDELEEVEAKLDQLEAAVRAAAGNVVIFTGAGISTSAGIADYRSPMDTKLTSGPGVWTAKAAAEAEANKDPASATPAKTSAACPTETQAQRVKRADGFAAVAPTPTHTALAALHAAGMIKHVVSQNIDGLHLRSGLVPSALSELHGNVNVERCRKCTKEFRREYPVHHKKLCEIGSLKKGAAADCVHCRGMYPSFCHCTTRFCDECGSEAGPLVDTIVNFGEQLHHPIIKGAMAMANSAKLCIVLGSSAQVHPAAEIPARADTCAVVNLCPTAADHLAGKAGTPERIGAQCDDIMTRLCTRLGVALPGLAPADSTLVSSGAARPMKINAKSKVQTVKGPSWRAKGSTSLKGSSKPNKKTSLNIHEKKAPGRAVAATGLARGQKSASSETTGRTVMDSSSKKGSKCTRSRRSAAVARKGSAAAAHYSRHTAAVV